jgi:hypothetical protein
MRMYVRIYICIEILIHPYIFTYTTTYVGDLNEGKAGTSATSDDNDQFLSASIPLDKWMIKTWLPIAFNGFDYAVIDVFVAKLRGTIIYLYIYMYYLCVL